MIDSEGFRANVGIIITNQRGQLLWAKRYAQNAWQFPQGGLDKGESPKQAMYRELYEEVGLKPDDVKILKQSEKVYSYKLPEKYIRQGTKPLCIGQKQKWFLLRLDAPDNAVRLDVDTTPEFKDWKWVSYWYPISSVVDFKQQVYRSALSELMTFNLPKSKPRRRRRKR